MILVTAYLTQALNRAKHAKHFALPEPQSTFPNMAQRVGLDTLSGESMQLNSGLPLHLEMLEKVVRMWFAPMD